MVRRTTFEVPTRGRGTYDLTSEVQRAVAAAKVEDGLCHVFVHHTSASLLLTENADPDVRRDLEAFFARLVPDGDPLYEHTAEGDDDMPAHVRTVLTRTSEHIPVVDGRLALGTWQAIYVWEHRAVAHARRLVVSVMGE